MTLDRANSGLKYVRRILTITATAGLVAAWIYGYTGHNEPVERYLPGALSEAAGYTLSFADTKGRVYLFNAEGSRGEPAGYVTVAEGQGYGGPMLVVTGWSLRGEVRSVGVPRHKEDLPWFRVLENRRFYDQFKGRKDTEPLRAEKDIDAVTGATFSARGVIEGVSKGRELVAKRLGHQIPKKEPSPIRFGFAEGFLLIGLGLSVLLRFVPSSVKTGWRRAFVLVFGFAVLGLGVQQPLSLVHLTTWMVGYVPPFRSHLFLYGLVFGPLFLLVFLGRNFYCFWLCPFSTVQEGAHLVTGSHIHPSKTCAVALRQTRYVILWIALLLAFLFRNPSIAVYEPWAALFSLRGTTEQWILVGLTLIAVMLVHNFWCSYLCPVGAVMELLMHIRHRVAALWNGRKC